MISLERNARSLSDFRKLKSICIFTKVQIIYKIEIRGFFFIFFACSKRDTPQNKFK